MSALLLASEGASSVASPSFPLLSVLILTPVFGALVVALILTRARLTFDRDTPEESSIDVDLTDLSDRKSVV